GGRARAKTREWSRRSWSRWGRPSPRAIRSLSSSSSSGRLLVDEPAPGVTRLTISNPGKRGALDHAILDGFAKTMPRLDARCVIVTGEGDAFSAGYDIGDLPDEVFAHEAEML